jgi:hypothetical protein
MQSDYFALDEGLIFEPKAHPWLRGSTHRGTDNPLIPLTRHLEGGWPSERRAVTALTVAATLECGELIPLRSEAPQIDAYAIFLQEGMVAILELEVVWALDFFRVQLKVPFSLTIPAERALDNIAIRARRSVQLEQC